MIKPVSSSLHFAARFALVGLVVGGYVAWSAIGDGWESFPVYSSTAALAGLLSHLLCWWLFILGAWIEDTWLTGGASQGEPPMNPLQGIIGAVVFSLFSLALFGWLTIPAGALIGCWMLRKQARSQGSAASAIRGSDLMRLLRDHARSEHGSLRRAIALTGNDQVSSIS